MSEYPLYDVPYLVRGANDNYMSQRRHEIEVKNQALVDDYFFARDRGASAHEARQLVAEKHQILVKKVHITLVWFYREAKKRKKYDFLEKFAPSREHISWF